MKTLSTFLSTALLIGAGGIETYSPKTRKSLKGEARRLSEQSGLGQDVEETINKNAAQGLDRLFRDALEEGRLDAADRLATATEMLTIENTGNNFEGVPPASWPLPTNGEGHLSSTLDGDQVATPFSQELK
jgi:hypothetical protein